MPWRIHFTADDLDRVEIGESLGPLAETYLALSLLRWPGSPRRALSDWRHQVRPGLSPRIKPLADLIPAGTHGVDLLTVTGRSATIEEGIVALLSAEDDALGAELEHFDRFWERLPGSVWPAADSGSGGRVRLADSTVAAYGALVGPYWPGLTAQFRAEQTIKARILAKGGGPALLTSLQTRWIRWYPPVLEVDNPSLAGRRIPEPVILGGHGIRFVPSLFTGDFPSLHVDLRTGRLRPMVIIPVTTVTGMVAARPAAAGRNAMAALARLIGKTRALALASVGDGCSTTELAARMDTSVAGASQHAGVLRDAGLIITVRQGGAVLHTLTPLGAQLLAGVLSQD
jgi:DNA-binding transcriptional ArsR family regulator